MWAIWSFLTVQNYPLHKYYIQRKSNLTCDKTIWEIYYLFFLAYLKFYINVNIFHPLDMSLSSKVVCGAHKHAIKLVFVHSLVYGILLFLGFCCNNVLHCLVVAYAKKWQVLESQGGEGNYAFFKLIFLSLSKCLMVLGIDVLKICIVKTWSVFSILHVQKLVFKLPLFLPKKKIYFLFINFNIYLGKQSTIYLTRGLFTYITTYTTTYTKYYLYYYWRSFPCLRSSFFLFKNTLTLLYLIRDKTKRQFGKNTTLTFTITLPNK